MYRAINLHTGSQVIILAPFWQARLALLRQLSDQDGLGCPGCLQPVRVRAGERKRWHFAHKHLENCAYGAASAAVLDARAVLFEWLARRFGERVSLEVALPDVALPHPIDCLLLPENPGAPALAFWVIDARLTPAARSALMRLDGRADLAPVWVLLEQLRAPDIADPTCLYLTTTERDFARPTRFDQLPGLRNDRSLPVGGSLHYLDPAAGTLTTYRGLAQVHAPQKFRGAPTSHPLDALEPAEDGGFVHPGEVERHQQARLERTRQVETYRQARRNIRAVTKGTAAACVLCGQITTNWWTAWHDDARVLCKCSECYRRGVS